MAKKMKNVVLTFHNVTDAIWFEKTIQLIGRFFTYGTLDQLYNRLPMLQLIPLHSPRFGERI